MPRNLLQISNDLPYHITARTNNREAFPIPLPDFWKILTKECLFQHYIYSVKFHAVVLMPNHFHAILTVPEFDLGKIMSELMKSVSRSCNLASGRRGHLFGGPYYPSLIRDAGYFGTAYKYVYRNPVRAKLCASVEDYPFSTIHGLVGAAALPFPIHRTSVGLERLIPPMQKDSQIDWLNKPFPKESEQLIQKGLRKRIFEAVKNRDTRMTADLLDLFP